MGVKNIPKAWEHARAAVLCEYVGDGSEKVNFPKFYNILIRNKLDPPGQSYDEVITQLGILTYTERDSKACSIWYLRNDFHLRQAHILLFRKLSWLCPQYSPTKVGIFYISDYVR